MRSGLRVFLAFGAFCGVICAQTDQTLRGAGATFPAPIYQKWIESFEAQTPGLPISYDPVGSDEGIRRLLRGEVDFAASDILPSQEIQLQVGVELLPSVVGAIVPGLQHPGVGSRSEVHARSVGGDFSRTDHKMERSAHQESKSWR